MSVLLGHSTHSKLIAGPHDLVIEEIHLNHLFTHHGRAGFDAFSHAKAVLRRPARFDSGLRFPPHSEGKLRRLRSFF
ncbi:MAG TPA: hypothetical protein PLR25_22705 [Planctomycetaceae bacterium]|nr:hypothetical protein [Planctomycetaceae bacterium]